MYKTIELFAGIGGLALGLEKAGLDCQLLNEIDKTAVKTLKKNRPNWNVVCSDISKLDFSEYSGKIDLITGGSPCQSFSLIGKRLGFEDVRGTLFYEFARSVKEVKPKMFVMENVKGLISHDNGRTLQIMQDILSDIGYSLIPPTVYKTNEYGVPQKRERLLLIGVRNDLVAKKGLHVSDISKSDHTPTLYDALMPGRLYSCKVPVSHGQEYSESKKKVLDLVPPGGYWKNLPVEIQKEYMGASFYQGGGKTGIARRLTWSEPCLTLTCSPAQKQTERCHPDETRPLTVREYARVQTFPDDWEITGSLTNQYKGIGNAVPVNFAERVGKTIIETLDFYNKE
jgi:DNA (cytosine-5)-methyltransferase 1